MKKLICILLFFPLLNCGNERVVQLPEIENAKITEVVDVSPAYIFYDDTQPDSTLFNRKNLISTTNWLVNVDKRLTLKQVIPYIQYLQNKRKKTSMHKNENAKNYFTCNDISIGNLGLVEFTNIDYSNGLSTSRMKVISQLYFDKIFIHPEIKNKNTIHIFIRNDNSFELKTITYTDFNQHIDLIQRNNTKDSLIILLNFDKNLSFQDYIRFKSINSDLDINGVRIDANESIY